MFDHDFPAQIQDLTFAFAGCNQGGLYAKDVIACIVLPGSQDSLSANLIHSAFGVEFGRRI
ncbi:MAG: hypothetical protein COT38_04490 [Candidatus Omnitrophica bacterium CG08_land_8_20_14_0_20_41_16]|nr:MAG: hypothetical protein COT38_04490 [Candidatus Omnitrophica bacterium CG08_land_8_20_14_0_20_41_16]